MSTYLYLRPDVDSSFGGLTKPSSSFGSYTYVSLALRGAQSAGISQNKGVTQQSVGPNTQVSGTSSLSWQFVSPPLAVGTVLAGTGATFDIGFALKGSVSGSYSMTAYVTIWVINSSGTGTGPWSTAGKMFASSTVGTAITPTSNTEATVYATGITLNATSYTTVSGDRIVVEIGAYNSGAGSQQITCYCGGATAITSNAAATSSAAAFINFSQTVNWANPEPSTLYMLPSSGAPGVLPAGFLGTWGVVATAGNYNGSGAVYASLLPTASQVSSSTVTSTSAGVQSEAVWQYFSDPLTAQTVSGTFTVATAELIAGSSPSWQMYLTIMFVTPAGTVRSTLFTNLIGNSWSSAGTYASYSQGLSLTSQTCVDGDRLCFEFGNYTTSNGTSTTAYAGGNVMPIGISGSVTAGSAGSFVQFAQQLLFTTTVFWNTIPQSWQQNAVYRM